MFQRLVTATVLGLAATLIAVAPVMAGEPIAAPIPAPGILGLVALGIIGAIALARLRK